MNSRSAIPALAPITGRICQYDPVNLPDCRVADRPRLELRLIVSRASLNPIHWPAYRMPKYLISYDLMKSGQLYEGLLPALRRLRAKQVLHSTWAIQSSLSAAEIRDSLRPHLDVHDRLAVIHLTEWAAYRTIVDLTDV